MCIILSCLCCVSADNELLLKLSEDFVPSENMKGNMINTDWNPASSKNYNQHNASGDAYEVEVAAVSAEDGAFKYTARRNLGHPRAVYSNGVATGSYKYNTVYALSGSTVGITKPSTPVKGNVLFSFQVKTDSQNSAYGTQKVQIGRTRYDLAENNPAGTEYPAEYDDGSYYGADQGFTVTTEYKTFCGTFVNAPDADSDTYKYYSIGLPMGSLSGARIILNTKDAYLGYEYAHDIKVSADKETFYYDSTISLDADILNQFNDKGGLSQSVTWYAMNAERTAFVDGFSFSEENDGKATVSISKSVNVGTYTLVAVSDEDENLVKGIKISVFPTNLSSDYVPGEDTGKLLTADPTTTDVVYGMYWPDSVTSMIDNNPTYWRVWTQKAIPESAYGVSGYGVGGVGIDENYLDKSKISAGDVLIIGTRIKDYANSPIFSAAIYTGGKTPMFSKEYPNPTDGFKAIDKNNFTPVNFTFKLPDDWAGFDKSNIYLGFPYQPDNEPATASVPYEKRISLEKASLYIGKEYAYDIKVSADKTSVLPGKSISVDADIVNQLGMTGYLEQNATWYALNNDRSCFADGFTINARADGKATVSVDRSVSPGKYFLVAVADNDSKLSKGIEITVADASGAFGDYVPKEVTGNLAKIKDANGNELFSLTQNVPYNVRMTTTNAGTDNEAWSVETIEDIEEKVLLAENGSAYYGYGAAGTKLTKSCYSGNGFLTGGKSIVFSADVRSTSGTPTVQLAMSKKGATPEFSKEYPAGLKLSDREWHDFNATIAIPDSGGLDLFFGYAYTGLIDECTRKFEIRKNSVYIGEEYPYDIEVVSGAEVCRPGQTSSFAVSATIYNQIGTTGNLDQSVMWYALNEERTEFAEGIEIYKNLDGTATVSISADVPQGSYDIVAVSNEYDGIQKGVTVKVGNPFVDYVPGEITGNLVTDTEALLTSNGNPSGVTVSSSGSGDNALWTVKTSYSNRKVTQAVLEKGGDSVGMGVGGSTINKAGYDSENLLGAGKNIVIGAKVRKSSSYVSNSTISAAMFQWGVVPTFPAEYPNHSDGLVVNNASDWQNFGATLHIPDSGWSGSHNTNFYMGFVCNDDNNYKGYSVKKNSFYIGEEYAYDIKVSADKTEWTKGLTSEITLDGAIINQVGTKGYLDQNITWHALNSIRTATVPGITITKNVNGTATLKISDSVPAGIYDIVAVSDVYEGFIKGIRITVDGGIKGEKINVFDLTESGGTATLSASVVNSSASEIFFALVSYDENGKMTKVEINPQTVENGTATVSYMNIGGVAKGYSVKGFVWDNATLRPIEFADGIVNTVITTRK